MVEIVLIVKMENVLVRTFIFIRCFCVSTGELFRCKIWAFL